MRIALFLITLLLCPNALSGECQKIMRWNDDAPFTYVDPANPDRVIGISADLAREALDRMGCNIVFLKEPWARALKDLSDGSIDMISNAYRKPDREVYAHFSTQGIVSPNVLFVRKEDAGLYQIKRLADLPEIGFRLGAQLNVSYSEEYDEQLQNPEFVRLLEHHSNRQSLWKMLSLHRIDGVIADLITGRLELRELGMSDQIVPTDYIISNAPSYFAFAKRTTPSDFVEWFDLMLMQMHTDGTYARILSSYLD